MTTIESSPEAVAATTDDSDAPSDASDTWLDRISDTLSSTDHKVIGRLYLGGGLLGLLTAVVLSVLISLERIDGADALLDEGALPQLFDGQRIALVFGALLPLAVAACIYAVPMQLGARSIAFPRLAAAGFWMWFGGLVLNAIALINNGGTLGSDSDMVGLFIVSMGLMAIGLTATAGAIATSILTTRAPGMTMRRIPPFSWSALVFALGVILVMPVFVGTLTYVFLDHRNGRTGFGGNEGIFDWVGWMVTQPATFLFAIPAIGLFAEAMPITFNRRLPARGVMFAGLALIGVAAFAAVTQQNLQGLPWAGSDLSTDDLGEKAQDLVPYFLFNVLPVIGIVLVALIALLCARPDGEIKVNITPAFVFGFLGFGMVLVGMVGNLLYAIDDLGLQGTVFEEATLVYIVYGAAIGGMGATIHWGPKLWGPAAPTTKAAPLAMLAVVGTVLAAFPLYIAGFLDQPAGAVYDDGDLSVWNILSTIGHGVMALTVIAFVGLLASTNRSSDDDQPVDDPWDGQTLEWTTTSPAPRDNFVDVPVVHSAEPLLDLKQAGSSATTDGSTA